MFDSRILSLGDLPIPFDCILLNTCELQSMKVHVIKLNPKVYHLFLMETP